MMRERLLHALATVRDIFQRLSVLVTVAVLSAVAFATIVFYVLNAPPAQFTTDKHIVIPEGLSVGEIAELFEEQGIVKSSAFFKFIVKSSYTDIVIQAGGYRFKEPMTTHEVVESLREGTAQSPLISLTFPEGFSIYDIREYTKDVFASIAIESLIEYEGFLFPETYFVSSTETIDDLVRRMRAEYEKRIEPYRDDIVASGMNERDVIILASILEREANDQESMKMVSGILQNRLRDNLPLQVDATFEYILGKTSAELTLEDLALNTPYNTYIMKGLPPTPIANPGIVAIEAVLNPIPSDFYYYLTGYDGTFHYAETFEEHKRNKERYLE